MTEAVVVTGARGEVILLNGAARRIFALSADTDYRGRDFVELCRDPRLQEFVGRSMRSTDNDVMSAEIMIQNPAPRPRQRQRRADCAPSRGCGVGVRLPRHHAAQVLRDAARGLHRQSHA